MPDSSIAIPPARPLACMASLQNRPKINRLIPRSSAQSVVSTSITLLEQAIFVNAALPSPSVLRGCVELNVAKTAQLQDLVINFSGVNTLEKFGRFNKEEYIIDRTWPVPQLELRNDETSNVLQPNDAEEWPVFKPGRYTYDFELNLNQQLPETFNVGGCKLKYTIQAVANVSGLRRPVSSQCQEVAVVHCQQDELNLHEANQISLSRIWNKQIYYHVELSDKSAPIGGNVPMAVRIGCSNILFIGMQVFLGQKIKFPGIPGKQAQLRKKLLLKSKCSDPSTGKFNDPKPLLNLGWDSGTAVIAGSVPLQDEPNAALKLHPDVNFKKVKATHTMFFLIDLTIKTPDSSNPEKTTICRLTAETAFRIRSPRTQSNDLSVPEYTEPRDLSEDYSLLPPPPPFSPSPSPSPWSNSQRPSCSSSGSSTTGAESADGTFSSPSSSSSSFTQLCSAAEHISSPPPAYDSIC